MKNAWNSRYDYEYFHEICNMVLPVLCVQRSDFDWRRFLDVSGMQWNSCFALKHPETRKTVLSFLTKNEKCVYGLRRSLKVLGIRVAFCLCMGMN